MNNVNNSIVCEDRAQELAAELMRHVLDDMQENGAECDQPMNARDKLEKQLRRTDNHAQQLDAEHEQRRECEVEFRNNCMYVVPQENGEQDE